MQNPMASLSMLVIGRPYHGYATRRMAQYVSLSR
jgi:hypothetical protein